MIRKCFVLLWRLSSTVCHPQAWRLRKGNGAVLVQIRKPKDQGSWWSKSQPENRRLIPPLSTQAGSEFSFLCLFYSGPQMLAPYPLTLGRANCFTQSTGSNANLCQKHTPRHTQNTVCLKWLGIPWPCEDDTLKLTTTYDLLHFCQLCRQARLWS